MKQYNYLIMSILYEPIKFGILAQVYQDRIGSLSKLNLINEHEKFVVRHELVPILHHKI